LFWREVEDFKKLDITNGNLVRERYREIHEKFIREEAPFLINISDQLFIETRDNVNKLPTSGHLPLEALHVFNSAQAEIYLLMSSDSFSRYLRSESYQQLLVLARSPEMSGKCEIIRALQNETDLKKGAITTAIGEQLSDGKIELNLVKQVIGSTQSKARTLAVEGRNQSGIVPSHSQPQNSLSIDVSDRNSKHELDHTPDRSRDNSRNSDVPLLKHGSNDDHDLHQDSLHSPSGGQRFIDSDDSSPLPRGSSGNARNSGQGIQLGVHRLMDVDDSSPLQSSGKRNSGHLGRLTETEEMDEMVPFHVTKEVDGSDSNPPSPVITSTNSLSLIITSPESPAQNKTVLTPSANQKSATISPADDDAYVV